MYHAGISVDNLVTILVTDVDESENNRYSIITYMKYNGTILLKLKLMILQMLDLGQIPFCR